MILEWFWIDLRSFWDDFGIILEAFWDYFEIILTSFQAQPRPIRGHSRILGGLVWDTKRDDFGYVVPIPLASQMRSFSHQV